MKIIELLREIDGFRYFKPTTESDVLDAETKLGMKFAKEYTEIIREYGAFSCLGHEFTGICESKRLNVVEVTLAERNNNPYTSELYVIENVNIDSILVWQSSDGTVYQTIGASKPTKISDSITEYIKK